MENNEPKERKGFKFKYIWIIIAVIFAAILIYTIVNHFLTTITANSNMWEIKQVIEKAKQSTADGSYVLSIVRDPYNNLLKVTARLNDVEWNAINPMLILGQHGYINLTLTSFAGEAEYTLLVNGIPNFWDSLKAPAGMEQGIISSVSIPREGLGEKIIRVISFMAPIIIGLLFIYLLFFRHSPFGAAGLGLDNKSLAQKIKTNTTFDDVAGNEEVKEEIKELVDYLKNPKKYQAAGARIPKGILLGGPPGTGKTLLAKATAGEANVPFFFISASNFVEMFVGLGAKRVRDMFADARKNAPAIIFIDELDAVGRSRGAGIGGGNDEREQTLNQILVEMDGIKENSGILIIAATNRTDVLDPALTRPGRFDRIITVGLPDVKERESILKLHAKGKRISPNVNFALVARRTPGFSGAQLENVINEASLLSVRERTNVITLDQIDEAIDRVIAGPAKKSRTISEKENIAVAYHEAGHAVVGLKLKGGNKVQKITIIPRGQAGGYNLMMPEEEKYNHTKSELIAMITSFMGGRCAEAIIYGENNISTGASDDIAKATRIARRMVTEWGMSALGPIKYEEDASTPFLGRDYMKNSSFSNKIGQEIDLEIRKIIISSQITATKIIKENLQLLELIKQALIIKETIVAEDIEYIEKNLKLPEDIAKTKEELKGEYSTMDFDKLFSEVTSDKSKEDSAVNTWIDELKAIEETKAEIEKDKRFTQKSESESKSQTKKDNKTEKKISKRKSNKKEDK
ncbi:cell division protease FtsH [Metamycoplasma subdolum]|uniref:ATP-dependent zinc metalloprotease FtsH n=1 Tax=Metamycoplasma subdolum TaxID=92407 RepID=A0A3M0A6V2_9BACT|nr:ATP-dependent zinc metalloprotease FtsH [Metamycoplasma subdolum]RMA78538.1 cell division protease FtsH [Metamycoplasma subdolum]WPB50470.1 ATP-dependent zinc metalloprotease FtsH [Metamycoplasma subdolum]